MTVRGWVVSKEPVTLKKAARIMSSFAARDNLAPQDVTNYLKRAAAAFDELLQFHRNLRNPGSFRSDDAAAGDGQTSARKPEAGESFGGKEPRKEKKRDESGSKPPVNGDAKVGIFREERRVDGVSEFLDVKTSKGKGRQIIVAGEMVEVKKLVGKGGGSAMVAVEESVEVAVEGNGEKAQVDGVDEQRSKVKRKEKRKNIEDYKAKMNNIRGSEDYSKKDKMKNKEGDEQIKKEEHSEKEKEKRKNREEGEEQNKIEKRKRKSGESDQKENKKSKRRRNE